MLLRMVFLLVASSIWALGHFYVGRRVIRPLELHGRRRVGAWTAVWVLWAAGPLTFLTYVLFPAPWLGPLQWASFLYMGAFSIFFAFTVVRDLGFGIDALVRRIARRGKDAAPESRARRRFLTNATNAGAAGLTGVLTGWGIRDAIRVPDVTRVDVPIAGLAPALDGYRIAQLTDLHIGPTIKGDWLRAVVERTNGLDADLIAVTGDLVDGPVSELRPHVAPLADLRARDGAYFVTGNHEYYSGPHEWCAEVRRLGLHVLLNEHRVLERDGATMIVAGVTDHRAAQTHPEHESSPEKALRGAPAADLKLLLAHQPRSIHEASRVGFDLQISGHTHNGQFFPWNIFVPLTQPFVAGLDRLASTWIYVSPGTGYWGPPMRGGVPSEITLLTLRTA